MSIRDDRTVFPALLYEKALGPRCVIQLNDATPRLWADHSMVRDRYLINPGALAYWLSIHFGINVFTAADQDYDVDPIGEQIRIGAETYLIPHWCYLSTGIEPGDDRPRSWPGIPAPVESEAV